MNHTVIGIQKAIKFLQGWDGFLITTFNFTYSTQLITEVIEVETICSDSFHHALDNRTENAQTEQDKCAVHTFQCLGWYKTANECQQKNEYNEQKVINAYRSHGLSKAYLSP